MKVRPSLLVYLVVQMVGAGFFIISTLIVWSRNQGETLRMSPAILLIVVPLESAAIGLAIYTYLKPLHAYKGAWAIPGIFRIIISFLLPLIPWIYTGPGPPLPGQYVIILLWPAEFFFGLITLVWLVSPQM